MNQSTLSRFRVIAQLGKGGMSDVYLAAAQGPGGFHKLMVLKVLKPELARDQQYCGMFQDEARLAARLNHPNVVQTYEVGEFEGRSFIAMEYLEGQPLSRVTERMQQRGVVPTAFALRTMIGTLDGLHYAHELRDYDGEPLCIVHRDATPQNVFLTYQGQIKLVDFGVAKSIGATSDTTVGTVKGKVSYMAPEQARGDDVDRRTDVFAMGIVLWELLSGRRLWEGLTDVAVIARLMQGDVPDLARENPELPETLTRLCMSALHPDPSQRPQTALELQLGLEKQLALLPVSVSQRKVGEVVTLAFGPEREQVRTVVARQLERLKREPISGMHAGAPRLHQLSATPLPILGALGSIHDMPTAAHTPTGADLLTGGSGTAVIARTGAGLERAGHKGASLVPLWALVASVLAGALVVGTASYWVFARRGAAPSRAALPSVPTPASLLAPPPATGCDAESKPLVELSGDIGEDATLRCDKEYLLKYTTSVQSGATLTIQAGTVIKGDRDTKGTLVVVPGGRIEASGTRDRPIVLTSSAVPSERRAGDWGGIVILGHAPTNHHDSAGRPVPARIEGLTRGGEYGGQDPDDSSGTLRFVRIEYSGDEIAPNNEINGLSLGGVGRGTVIDHVLVRHTADDCFEFFGGTVDARHLVCQDPGDDAFDWDFGYAGRLQFLVAQASAGERSGSNGLEGDSDPAGSSAEPVSRPSIYNATLCGKNRKFSGEHYGLLLRRGTGGLIRNTIVTGFLAGLDVRDRTTALDVQNTTFFGNVLDNLARTEVGVLGASAPDRELLDDDGGLDERALLTRGTTNNLQSDPRVRGCFDRASPDFRPERSLEGSGVRPPDDGFFDPTADFQGALRGPEDPWLRGAWARLED